MSQYHVVPRHGRWHLYLDDSTTALADGISKVEMIKAARAQVRARGGRVIVHLEQSTAIAGSFMNTTQGLDGVSAAQRDLRMVQVPGPFGNRRV